MVSLRTRLILFIIFVLGIFLRTAEYTSADLFAERLVKNNLFSMTTLSFSERNTANNTYLSQLIKTNGLQPGGFDLGAVRIKKDGKLNFKYQVKAEKINGDDSFCLALNLIVLMKEKYIYRGRLLDFSLEDTVSSDSPVDWIFFVSLDDSNANLKNKICEFNFRFRTFRINPGEQGGFFAERLLYNNITSGIWD